MDPFVDVVRALHENRVRFLVIGVWGANYYAPSGASLFLTHDRDLFLPLDPPNLLRAWNACAAKGLELRAGSEPLGEPRDLELARAVVRQRSLTHAVDDHGLHIDLSLLMEGFEFNTVWSGRRIFLVDGVEIPVARLGHIVQSKAAAGREKDRLFLAAHEEALRQMVSEDDSRASGETDEEP